MGCVEPQRALPRTTSLLENQTPTDQQSETHSSVRPLSELRDQTLIGTQIFLRHFSVKYLLLCHKDVYYPDFETLVKILRL